MLPTSLKNLARTVRMSRQATTAAIKFAICNMQYAICNLLKAALLGVATSRCGRVETAGKGERKVAPLFCCYIRSKYELCKRKYNGLCSSRIGLEQDQTKSRPRLDSDLTQTWYGLTASCEYNNTIKMVEQNDGTWNKELHKNTKIPSWKNILKIAAMVAILAVVSVEIHAWTSMFENFSQNFKN